MVFIFNLIGLLLVVLGLAGAALVFVSGDAPGAAAMAARFAVAVPMLGVAFSGLLCLAIGGALSRLDRIVNNTADIADAMDAAKQR